MNPTPRLQLLVLAVVVPLTHAAWEDGDDGVDRRNGDLAGFPVALKADGKPADCAAMCMSNAQCTAWAYGKANCHEERRRHDGQRRSRVGQADDNPMCWLKGSVTPQNADKCRVG